jgi:type II secretory pathway component PulM
LALLLLVGNIIYFLLVRPLALRHSKMRASTTLVFALAALAAVSTVQPAWAQVDEMDGDGDAAQAGGAQGQPQLTPEQAEMVSDSESGRGLGLCSGAPSAGTCVWISAPPCQLHSHRPRQ